MKKTSFLVLTLILILAAVYMFSSYRTPDKIEVIMLDPGHGHSDPGCVYDDIKEKDINYDIALRLGELLESSGYKIIYTHDGSRYLSPHERAETANSKGADLYISIHQNGSSSEDATGIETWYSSKNRYSKRLAACTQDQLIESTGAKDRGTRLSNSLIVVQETNMPSILIECGFLSNPDEREKLNNEDYRMLIAESIAQAVDEFAQK